MWNVMTLLASNKGWKGELDPPAVKQFISLCKNARANIKWTEQLGFLDIKQSGTSASADSMNLLLTPDPGEIHCTLSTCIEKVLVLVLPGRMRFFRISVPVAVAFSRQVWAFSKASCPWSPHSLQDTQNIQKWGSLCIINAVQMNLVSCECSEQARALCTAALSQRGNTASNCVSWTFTCLEYHPVAAAFLVQSNHFFS